MLFSLFDFGICSFAVPFLRRAGTRTGRDARQVEEVRFRSAKVRIFSFRRFGRRANRPKRGQPTGSHGRAARGCGIPFRGRYFVLPAACSAGLFRRPGPCREGLPPSGRCSGDICPPGWASDERPQKGCQPGGSHTLNVPPKGAGLTLRLCGSLCGASVAFAALLGFAQSGPFGPPL